MRLLLTTVQHLNSGRVLQHGRCEREDAAITLRGTTAQLTHSGHTYVRKNGLRDAQAVAFFAKFLIRTAESAFSDACAGARHHFHHR